MTASSSGIGPVHRFLVTAPIGQRIDIWAVTGRYANWIEGRGPAERETWLVTCFDQHAARFRRTCAARDKTTLEEIEGAGDDERYTLVSGNPEAGWRPEQAEESSS